MELVKVGGGLAYVTGPMGAGKTLFAVRKIVDAVLHRRYAVTNVELLPHWAERVALHVAPTKGAAARRRIADGVRGFYVYEDRLEQAMTHGLPCDRCGSLEPWNCPGERGHRPSEGRGILVWDEGQNELNNRDFRERDRRDKERKEAGASFGLLEWATQLRKLGFLAYLLTQAKGNTEKQLREIANYHVMLQNQRETQRAFGVRITPWPLFLAFWYSTNIPDAARTRNDTIKIERYFLSWHRHLYDTMGLYHALAGGLERGDIVMLPPEGRAHVPTGTRPAGATAEEAPA